ncbi:SDR family oxidoreductase [Paraferrimonas sp. SM1919]|uniref:SDR family NAD(P)-dependent oxidoreductase n=1 Tax=Paraferrimonas sp. SM1919 TaxID=2662263 RepID=UPI0013D7060F|nr:SDR family oxidoreductase [Paraferrimonas sp. SM1919]
MNIVITGGSKGIGKGLAIEFSRLGHQVMISGRDQIALDEVTKNHPRISSSICDSTSKPQLQHLWDEAQSQFGRVDIWINNAALARTVWSFLDTPDAEIETMVQTNILGTINASKIAANGMLKQAKDPYRGKIVTVLGGGSDGEYFPGMAVYGTTKRALNYFTDALVHELKDEICVLKVRPGMVITEGVIREAKANYKHFQLTRNLANVLCDTVADVSPFLANKIISTQHSGSKIAWLTPWKIKQRIFKAKFITPPDKFIKFGL